MFLRCRGQVPLGVGQQLCRLGRPFGILIGPLGIALGGPADSESAPDGARISIDQLGHTIERGVVTHQSVPGGRRLKVGLGRCGRPGGNRLGLLCPLGHLAAGLGVGSGAAFGVQRPQQSVLRRQC